MSNERHVQIFRYGRHRAMRIPREFVFPGENAIMRKEGRKLIIEPVSPKSLLAVLKTLEPIRGNFPPIEDSLPEPVEL